METREREAANAGAMAWAASERKYTMMKATERSLEWLEYHRRPATTHEGLAERHRQAAGKLIDGGAGPP